MWSFSRGCLSVSRIPTDWKRQDVKCQRVGAPMESPNRRCFETPDGPCVFFGTVISVETVYSCLDIFKTPLCSLCQNSMEILKLVTLTIWRCAVRLDVTVICRPCQAYNLPQGVISHLFRDIAAKRPRSISKVGHLALKICCISLEIRAL